MMAQNSFSLPSLLGHICKHVLLTISSDPGNLGGATGNGEKQQQQRQGQEGLVTEKQGPITGPPSSTRVPPTGNPLLALLPLPRNLTLGQP